VKPRPLRIFIPRPADAANLNPQAKNAQHVLRYWRSRDCRPAIAAFAAPDELVAANRNVDILKLRHDQLWPVALYLAYFRRFDAVFYPGVHHCADWLALKTRAWLGWRLPVITTVEGLAGGLDDDTREREYSAVAGHRVYCHGIPQPHLRRVDDICRMADHIIAISPFLARMARSRYGDKVSVLPLGVDTEMFARPSFSRRARLRVVGAGRVARHKRPELFVALAEKFPQADFVWFGEGDRRCGLVAEIARRGLDNLAFPGSLSPQDLAQEFAGSDIFLLPSLSEGVPKVTQEAAAAGLAQIIFGFYESPTVTDGVNGFVVWSDEELCDRLAQLCGDRDLVETMGRTGQGMARDWSWQAVAPQWEQRIINILSPDGSKN
jgi:glycosyltransferase involved in cell wall biosynthesis